MSLKAVEEVSAEVPADDFQALEDKVYRTIEMYKAAREAERRRSGICNACAQQLKERDEEIESLRREAVQLRKEREEVRGRVEKMMRQIDAIGRRAGCQLACEVEGSKTGQRGEAMATATRQNPAKDANNNSVRVEIFDQAYNLRGSDPEYILKLADYVDSKMRAVAEQTNTIDTVRLAVLAALNIADEYHLLKRNSHAGASRCAAGQPAVKRAG